MTLRLILRTDCCIERVGRFRFKIWHNTKLNTKRKEEGHSARNTDVVETSQSTLAFLLARPTRALSIITDA